MKNVFIIVFVFSICSCGQNTNIDKAEEITDLRIQEILQKHSVLKLSNSEAIRRMAVLDRKYGHYVKSGYIDDLYFDLLVDESTRQKLFANKEMFNELGGYFLIQSMFHKSKREKSIELGKKIIDAGLNPFEFDYFGVTPVVSAASYDASEIFDYIMQKDEEIDYVKGDDDFVRELKAYRKLKASQFERARTNGVQATQATNKGTTQQTN